MGAESARDTAKAHFPRNLFLPLQELARGFPRSQTGADLAYAESQDALRWLVERKGRDVLFTLIAELHAGNNFDTAFETVVGWDLATYDIRWRESLAERYRWAIPLFQFLFFLGGTWRSRTPGLPRLSES